MSIKIRPIICVGGANIDHKFLPKGKIVMGTSNPITSISSFGGVARNVAENLSHWTDSIYLQTLLGDDIDGRNILAHLQSLAVNTDFSVIGKDIKTSHYYAILNNEGDLHSAYADMNSYEMCPRDTFVENMQKWPKDSLVFVDTNFPEWIFTELAKLNQHHDFTICIDPVSVAKCEKLPNDLSAFYLIKPNRDEATKLSGIDIHDVDTAIRAANILLKRGVSHVILSLGADGYIIADKSHQIWRHAFVPDYIIDANGAGDAFIAGILFGLQQSLPLNEACKYGAAAANLTLGTNDTVKSDISLKNLQTLIQHSTVTQVTNHANLF